MKLKLNFFFILVSMLLVVFFEFISDVEAGVDEQAATLIKSLTGMNPTAQEKAAVAAILATNLPSAQRDAARYIIDNYKEFLTVTVKTLATPWSNRDFSPQDSLNDMTALVIGAVRDSHQYPFGEILWKNVMYHLSNYNRDDSLTPIGQNEAGVFLLTKPAGSSVPAWYGNSHFGNWDRYWVRLDINQDGDLSDPVDIDEVVDMANRYNNTHFTQLENYGLDLSNDGLFSRTLQNPILMTNVLGVAGIYSTRKWGESFYTAGTNRRAFAHTMKNFFCKEMEELSDITAPDFRVRRDVDRAPGGITATYANTCKGCHGGQDGMAGAFAYYDFNGVTRFQDNFLPDGTPALIAPKMNHNAIFPDGFITTSDSFINLWASGKNAGLFSGASLTAGNGPKQFGKMIAESDQFHQCMSKQVFELVCNKKMVSSEEVQAVSYAAQIFRNQNQNMKELFVNAGVFCMGE